MKNSVKNKGIVVPLYPNKHQVKQLNQYFGNARFLWNTFLYKNIKYHEKTGKFKFYYDMTKYLTKLKKENQFLQLSPSQSLQQTLKDLDKAFKSCFKLKFGFPKFKSRNFSNSIRFPQGFFLKKKSILLPKLGHISSKIPSLVKVVVKNVTVYRNQDGKYFASLCCEFKPEKLPKTKRKVGIDVGTTYLATGSNGKHLNAFDKLPSTLELVEKIKKIQRKLSNKPVVKKKENGKSVRVLSNSYLKCKKTLAKFHRKLHNKRKDYLHKFSTLLVRNYDLIVVEDLKVKNMTKSNKGTVENPGKMRAQKKGLNRNILSNGWYLLFEMLEYKCSWYGKTFKKVDPKYTSQTCSSCGFTSKKNRESQAVFVCKSCGFSLNADVNAAKNILKRAA